MASGNNISKMYELQVTKEGIDLPSTASFPKLLSNASIPCPVSALSKLFEISYKLVSTFKESADIFASAGASLLIKYGRIIALFQGALELKQ